MVTFYCYGVETPRHGMTTVEELRMDGWVKVKPHPWYKDTWLMRKEESDGDSQTREW